MSKMKLDILSNIAGDIVDSCAAQRIKLIAKLSRKRPNMKKIFTLAMAAVLFLAVGVSVFLFIFRDGRQVPVYQGMTVSSEYPIEQMKTDTGVRSFLALYDQPSFHMLAHKEQGLHDNRPNKKTAEDGTVLDPESGASLFYANQNEDFYITVHIDNPDKFEILSFTLNGEKYSSYMFEPGSDMENLILKCNVGDATGIVEYTIDAIKYVDDTEIKDVRMEGDQTVKVGVYTEEQPVAILAESEIGFGEIGFDVSINDPQGLLGLLESEVSAILYKDGAVVESQAVNIDGTTSVRFTGLDDGAQYRIAVIANYDAFDGAGKTEHTIGEKTVTTPAVVTPQVSGVSYTEAVAKLVWHDDAPDKNAVSFALYKGDEKIRDLSGNEEKLTDLLSGTEYMLKVEYKHNGAVKSREVTFTTKKVGVPTLAISDLQPDLYSVSFKLNESDPLDLLTVDKILLKQGDSVVATANGTAVEFTDLELLQTYTVEVTYSYDLLDGSGKQTKTITQRFGTQSKGLKVENGVVVGIGTCTDTKIYVNMPIGDHAFESAQITEVTMGSGVTSIGESAFAVCYGLKAVNISEGVTKISDSAFNVCKNLEQVSLPDSLTSLGIFTFAGCIKLSKIDLPSQMTSIGDRCFQGSGIIEITVPEGITVLPERLLAQCYQLTEVNLPRSLTVIELAAFEDCTALQSLQIPDGVKQIKEYAFRGCNEITVNIPTSVTTIESEVFDGNAVILTNIVSQPAGWKYGWAEETVSVIWNFKEFKTDSQGVTYALKNDGTAEVVSYNGNASTIRLEIEGYRTTKIARNAFHDNPAFNNAILIIPASVETMEANTFEADYSCKIYCEAPEKPAGWHDDWNSGKFTIIWGYTG